MNGRGKTRRLRRRRTERRIEFLLLTCLMTLAGGLSFYLRGESYSNCKTTGEVKIEIQEPEAEKARKKEGLAGEQVWVSPGEVIRKDPTIVVREGSKPACLRVKILISGLNRSLQKDLEDGICLCEGWKKNPEDGYYYYTRVVEEEEQIPVFNGIIVPEAWGQLGQEPYFRVEVQAEAAEYGYQYLSGGKWNPQE
ncbi:MAG: hypothetical protein SOZ59_12090 [Candidatus Limivivens sp.]|nr:hypothetical protein [Candidatus Limivivens sp.]